MPLNEKQKRHLRALGHKLKPVVLTGNAGLTEAVYREIDAALAHHELIKVRVNAEDRGDRDAMITEICDHSEAQLIQRIGHIALLYRRNEERPRIQLP